eukprot:6496596-Pyramimonas_sp.AAC.1
MERFIANTCSRAWTTGMGMGAERRARSYRKKYAGTASRTRPVKIQRAWNCKQSRRNMRRSKRSTIR